MNERDTHFQGFAKLLYPELKHWFRELFAANLDRDTRRAENVENLIKLILAQRAYDLFVHDRMNTGTSDLQHAASTLEAEEMVKGIPDLTAWPVYEDES